MIPPAASTIRSDTLSTLRPMFNQYGLLTSLGTIFQIVLIVDANIVIRDLLWMTKKRKNPNAKPEFFELLVARTVVGIAPTFLQDEMAVNLAELSAKRGIPLELLEEHWASYAQFLTFIDAGGPDFEYEDPKDAPYLKLQKKSNHLILSKDSDISRMGGRVASEMLVSRLCIYSRHAAIEYTLKAGGTGTVMLSIGVVKGIITLSRAFTAHANKLPRWLIVGVLLALVGASLHRPTREIFLRLLQAAPSSAKTLGNTLLNQLAKLTQEHSEAKLIAQEALSEIDIEISDSHPAAE